MADNSRGKGIVDADSSLALPQPLQDLFDEDRIVEVYSLALGCWDSFFIAYEGRDGYEHVLSQKLPQGLTDFVRAKDAKGDSARDIGTLRVVLGPQNETWYVDDAKQASYILPDPLHAEVLALQQGDSPRVIALGPHGTYVMVSCKNKRSIRLTDHYESLREVLEALTGPELGLMTDLSMDPHRLGSFILQAQNGNTMVGELTPHTVEAAMETTQRLKTDVEAAHAAEASINRQQAQRAREQDLTRQYAEALAEQRARANKWSRRLGYAQMFASLVGAGVGILQVENAWNGVNGTFGADVVSVDPDAFWAPIQDAASMPIQ